jgi:RND family efflux transporter MFP subunit
VDIPRARKGNTRRYLYAASAAAVLLTGSVALASMGPAVPKLDGAGVWTGTVRRGTMLREVRGPGTLVPEQVRWISAVTAGRVERILVQPGQRVEPGTPLLVMSNPDVQRDALEGQRQLGGAEAERASLAASLENQRLSQEGALATLRAEQADAQRVAAANRELVERGVVSRQEQQRSQDHAEELASRLRVEEERLRFLADSRRAQLAAQQSQIDRLRGLADFQRGYVESMRVTAGTDGVVRELPLQEGQWVTPGSPLAVVVRPGRLKAQLRIPETQARDLVVGQPARVDTRNGIVRGRVSRIDPAVHDGTVTVDVALEGELPRGARPDLSVDGVVEIERLRDVLYVDRPATAQAGSTSLFRVEEGGRTAVRVPVRLGRSSASTIEVVSGLRAGDTVILADMSAWDSAQKVRLR